MVNGQVAGETLSARHQTGIRKFLKRNGLALLAIGALIVVIAGFIITKSILDAHNNRTKQQNQDFANMMNQVKRDRDVGNDSAAEKVLNDFIHKYPNNKDRVQRYKIDVEFAAIYQSPQDSQNAKAWLERALADNPSPTFNDYLNLAELNRQQNDASSALQYYKTALDVLAKQGVKSGPQFTYINYQINNLKAQQGGSH